MFVNAEALISKAIGVLESANSTMDPERSEAKARVAMGYLKAAEILGGSGSVIQVDRFSPR